MTGIAITSARAAGPQCLPSSSRSTSSPSENRVRISASSIVCSTRSEPAVDGHDVERGQHDPGDHRQHRDVQHARPQPAGQRRGDRQQRAQQQQGLGEVEVHRGRRPILTTRRAPRSRSAAVCECHESLGIWCQNPLEVRKRMRLTVLGSLRPGRTRTVPAAGTCSKRTAPRSCSIAATACSRSCAASATTRRSTRS